MDSSLAVAATVAATVFEAYLEQALLPHPRPGRIVCSSGPRARDEAGSGCHPSEHADV
jgi:hypothetical protein